MEKQLERSLKEWKETLKEQRIALDKNTTLLMADKNESSDNKEYMKSFNNRLNEAISKGDTESLTSLKDEILNKIKS